MKQLLPFRFQATLFVAIFISCSVKLFSQTLCLSANAGPDKTICAGGSTTIGRLGLTGYTYSWSPTSGLNNPNISQPTASPLQTTTYTLTVTPQNNLLQNGNFEQGNIGFSSDYLFHPNGLEENTFGRYSIVTSPSNISNNWCNIGDHTSGSTNMLIADCSQDVTKRIWYQNVAISQNTTYYFSGFAYSIGWPSLPPSPCPSSCGNPIVQVRINGSIIIDNLTITYQNCANGWTLFQGSWNSGSNTNALIEIRSIAGVRVGNDIALDDLSFTTDCPATTDQVIVNVNQNPTVSPAGPITYYNQYESTTEVVLTSSPASSYQWYKNNVSISGATNQTYTINMTGLFNSTDVYKCVTSCGTSNSVTFNYRGCDEASDYPVSIPWSPWPCKSTITNTGIQLNAPSLGSGTSYSYWLYNPSYGLASCYIINSTGLLKCDGNICTDGVYVKSALNGAEIYMYYTFTTNPGCRVRATDLPISLPDHTEIAPNPASTEATISSPGKINKIEVYNMGGTQVKKLSINNSNSTKVSVSDFKPGVYLFKVYTENGVDVLKLQIQR